MATIIITGASGALGTIVTGYLLEKGYTIAAIGSPNHDMSTLGSHPALYKWQVNLEDEKATGECIQKIITRTPDVRGAILLAGGLTKGDLSTTDDAAIAQQISTNFTTAYHVIRSLFPYMMQRREGRIVLIAAKRVFVPADAPSFIAYTLSKGMLVQLAEILNEAGKHNNVTASVVASGHFDTAKNREAAPGADYSGWVKPEALSAIFELLVSPAGDPLRQTVIKAYGGG